jgi:DNA ligase 1
METKRWPVLYTKTSGGKTNFWEIWTEDNVVHTKWGAVDGKFVTDSYEAKGKNIGRTNETTPTEQAQLEAQSKFEKKKRVKYFETIAQATRVVNIKPMLAHTLTEKRQEKLEFPVTCQPKLNGVRCFAYNLPDGSVRLMSRGGKDYTVPHVQDELKGRIPDGVALDGELYAHGVNLQTIRHYIQTYSSDSLAIGLHCYDYTQIPPNDNQWLVRHISLKKWFADNPGLTHVVEVDSWRANDLLEIKSHHDAWVSSGYEGLIVRLNHGTYRLGARSTELLKLKEFQDSEFKVVGYKVGKDGVPTFRCLQEEGLEFEARPVGTMEERAVLMQEADSKIGQLLTVRFFERSGDNIPIFPVGVSFRTEEDM